MQRLAPLLGVWRSEGGELTASWGPGKQFLEVRHQFCGAAGEVVCVDRFDYEDGHYVRRRREPDGWLKLQISGGWEDHILTWTSHDCTARTTYTLISEQVLHVREQAKERGQWVDTASMTLHR